MLLTEEHNPQTFRGAEKKNSRATRKILHLINGEHFSGAERVQDLLGLRLPQWGYQIGFACLKPDKFPSLRQSTCCELFETPMGSRLDWKCVAKIVDIVRQNGFSALHAHTPRTLLIARLAAARLGCPLIYHVHSPVGRDSNRGLSNRLNTLLERWCLARASKIICVSKSLANYMRGLGHPESKIAVVSNGVALVEDVPHRMAPGDVWVLGVMALFRPRKGLEVLLDAVAILKKQGTAIQLRAVGPFETQDYQTEILRRVDRLGIGEAIEWTGFQQNVNSQLRKMDLFVLPSLYGEGMPMVVLEAMANAIPVVATRVEGIPEVIRDDLDGLIVEPGDPEQLANRLQVVLGDPQRWEMMSRSSYDRQRCNYSDISMSKSLAAIYDEIFHA
jgi:glycosyltransferase involved in cell wall biosynthesis